MDIAGFSLFLLLALAIAAALYALICDWPNRLFPNKQLKTLFLIMLAFPPVIGVVAYYYLVFIRKLYPRDDQPPGTGFLLHKNR